jgi:hypothetical protein
MQLETLCGVKMVEGAMGIDKQVLPALERTEAENIL